MYGDDSNRDLNPQQYRCESLKTRKSLYIVPSSKASVSALVHLLPFMSLIALCCMEWPQCFLHSVIFILVSF